MTVSVLPVPAGPWGRPPRCRCKAVVRVVFKPLIDALPIVGGMELYFISLPSLDYNLGGMANFAEIPGISNVSSDPGCL